MGRATSAATELAPPRPKQIRSAADPSGPRLSSLNPQLSSHRIDRQTGGTEALQAIGIELRSLVTASEIDKLATQSSNLVEVTNQLKTGKKQDAR